MSAQVDTPLEMLTLGDIAARDGISKQAVSKKLKSLLKQHDIPVERDGRDRIVKVSIADFDYHCGRFANPAKSQPKAETPPLRDDESFDEARRRGEWMKVRQAELRLEEEAGNLVRADRLSDGLMTAGQKIRAEVNRLQNRADDVALAVSREGASGARLELRKIASEINTAISDALAALAKELPEHDPVLEAEE